MISTVKKMLAPAAGWVINAASRYKTRMSERARWRAHPSMDVPRVYYGRESVPSVSEHAAGGLIKLQDLGKSFPNDLLKPNLLYLVSSALHPHADLMVDHALKAGAKVVINQNGVGIPAYHGSNIEAINAPRRKLIERADWVVYQSEFCKESSDRFLCARNDRFSILYNPVDTSFFAPDDAEKDLNRPVLLIGGSHHHDFRVHSALKVLSALCKGGVNARLSIAGRLGWRSDESQCQSDLSQWMQQLKVVDSVDMLGSYTQTEAPVVMRKAHILLHAKYMDPCPRLVVEGMACGLPVVYSDTGGVPELVGRSAGIGVSPSKDWSQIVEMDAMQGAEAVHKILSRYKEYSAAARQRAVSHLDTKPWIDAHAKLFSRLVSGSMQEV